jgi:lipoprotein NlpD
MGYGNGRLIIWLSFILCLFSCSNNSHTYAPVVNGWQQQTTTAKNIYIVQKNDTIYSIAWAFNRDYRDLANINHLSAPYIIHVGQKLNMTPSSTQPKPVTNKAPKSPAPISHWLRPAQGKVIKQFNLHKGNKGIDITGRLGEPVLASNSGIVVYNGSGLPGYGKLLIIKHNATFLSAYAHNRYILVKQGQTVTRGQKIATMGRDNSGQIILHFEIRQNGKPVDPLHYLGH